MAAPNDILTLSEAKAAINSLNTTIHDAELPGIITGLSTRLDGLIGPVVQRPAIEFHDGGKPEVFLYLYPVMSVMQVTEYDGTDMNNLAAEVAGIEIDDCYLIDRYSVDPILYGNRLRRRNSGYDGEFPKGRQNVRVEFAAGRYSSTDTVAEHYKLGARLMLINYWRSQLETNVATGEFDLPSLGYPRYTVPKAVRDHFRNECQDGECGRLFVG